MKAAPRVLVVEDEKDLCHLIERYLQHLGYAVETASSGEEACNVIGSAGGVFDVYLIDITLPGMQGDELADRMIRDNPSVKIILSSGYSNEWRARETDRTSIRYLPKPYQPKQLADMLQALAAQ